MPANRVERAARGSPFERIRPLTPGHAASVRRHPSSAAGRLPVRCAQCGFEPPPPARLADAVEQVPAAWAGRLLAQPTDVAVDAASRVRDELHIVANRIDRLVRLPGLAVLARVNIDAPRMRGRGIEPSHLHALLRLAADRLATLLRSLAPGDWQLRGQMGARSVGPEDLVTTVLHRSHARLVEEESCQ